MRTHPFLFKPLSASERLKKRRCHACGMEERMPAQRVHAEGSFPLEESVAVEAPLSIHLNGVLWTTTMRTPGADADLVRGMLHSSSRLGTIDAIEVEVNVVHVEGDFEDGGGWTVLRTSACGVCGIESLPPMVANDSIDAFRLRREDVNGLLDAMRSAQSVFDATGGVHAVGLFSAEGLLLDIAEDVGRHNAMEKVIGRHLDALPLNGHGFLLSGRISFEMVQKAIAAGSPCVIAVGAPTTLAVELAREHGLTLIGFARDGRFNVYAGAHRLEA